MIRPTLDAIITFNNFVTKGAPHHSRVSFVILDFPYRNTKVQEPFKNNS